MGQVWQARPDAYLRLVGVSDDLVVGQPARDRNSVAIVSGQLGCFRSHRLALSPDRVLERRSAANVACPTRTKEGPLAASMRNLARRSPVEHSFAGIRSRTFARCRLP